MNRSVSLYLDIVRPLAALVVLLSHISLPQLTGQLKFFSNAGSQAVDVFFVLSGFVISHVCATREYTLREYALARAVRIYSVALPAIIITFLLDLFGMSMQPAVYTQGYQPITPLLVLRSVFFLGEQWGAHRYPGSNSAYWSLGFEVWYYVAYGAFVFSGWIAAIATLLFIGPKVSILFPLWLMGVVLYRLCDNLKMSRAVSWMCILGPICTMVFFEMSPLYYTQAFMPLTRGRLPSLAADYFVGIMFSIHLIGVASLSGTFAPFLERYSKPIQWIAGATFSVYLMHLPIMHFLVALTRGRISIASLVIATLATSFLVAQYTERKKHVWKRMFQKLQPVKNRCVGLHKSDDV